MKIVIVDGDREAGKFIKDCLMTLHFDCEIAGNERDGLKTALREDCVCVITEVVLPGRDGIHLCSEIRKERDIPIIFISSEGGDASKVRAFGAGADDYMVFSKEHLLDRVWGIDAVGDSSTVTVHIQRIREKINRGGETYIETVWGAGYRMKS